MRNTKLKNNKACRETSFGSKSAEPILLEWTIKAYSNPTWPMDLFFAAMVLVPLWTYMNAALYPYDSSTDFMKALGSSGVLMIVYLWWGGARQKTLYYYWITKSGGEVLSRQYLPKWAGYFLRGLVVNGFVMAITMVGIMPDPIAMIGGAVGMIAAAGMTLMKREPSLTELRRASWSRHDLVFIDRKRKMVVTSYHDNLTSGFEVRLKKEQINEFVIFLKAVIPDAEFREETWEW